MCGISNPSSDKLLNTFFRTVLMGRICCLYRKKMRMPFCFLFNVLSRDNIKGDRSTCEHPISLLYPEG